MSDDYPALAPRRWGQPIEQHPELARANDDKGVARVVATAAWLPATATGVARCPVGDRSRFDRSAPVGIASGPVELVSREWAKALNPVEVDGDAPHPTELRCA
ncbi:MAG: hypothetical protein B7733_07040 [Myxococcales bacterium FL481]|nr:MAG: hypothetical protein B7733_07040 [Myxococcales bacterium FL481]